MNKNYLLGVDGGNTKTDFMLFDTQGSFVDYLRTGTCSHEALKGSYSAAKAELDRHLTALCERNNISRSEIAASVFGLAGIDTALQRERLTAILTELGMRNFIAINDSFLSIKSVSRDGTGICSINGTGTVAGGIDRGQRYLQVGGIGAAVGDSGGGRFFAEQAIRAVYNQIFRNGIATSMTEPMLSLLDVSDEDCLMAAVSDKFYGRTVKDLEFMKILFSAANENDPAALSIVKSAAAELANSVIGCARCLDFGGEIHIVTAGSIWVKCETPILYERFCSHVRNTLAQDCEFFRPDLPPICGAVNWAFQLYEGVERGCLRMESIHEAIARVLA